MKHPYFADSDQYFSCPTCKQILILEGQSLCCVNRHTFDIARQGYVNLAPQVKQSTKYDKSTFAHRQTFLEKGYYDHLYQAIEQTVIDHQLTTLFDSGCGEGYYSRKLAQNSHRQLLAMDLSKESIALAARTDRDKQVKWFVGDLTQIPLQAQTVDGILDIFSPANYQEFQRILRPGGVVLKMIPGPNHLKELRHVARKYLRSETYENQAIVEHTHTKLNLLHQEQIGKTLAMSPEVTDSLVAMTPLLFHVNTSQLDLEQLTAITIEGILLVGTMD